MIAHQIRIAIAMWRHEGRTTADFRLLVRRMGCARMHGSPVAFARGRKKLANWITDLIISQNICTLEYHIVADLRLGHTRLTFETLPAAVRAK